MTSPNSSSAAPERAVEHERLPALGLLLLAAIAVGWGLNWPIMKVVLSEVPPLSFRGSCLTLGGLGMLFLARCTGQSPRIPAGAMPRLLLLSATNIVGWNVLIVYGLLTLPSGRGALLGYTMPLWGICLSVWLLKEQFTARKLLGLILGFSGVGLLIGESLGVLSATPVGVACMLGAAFFWALGVVLIKRLPVAMPTMALTGWMMLLGGVPIAVAALLLETDKWHPLTFWPAFGLVYNLFVAFMFCYWAWNRIVLMVPVSVSSLSSLVTPLIGLAGGMAFLGERPGWQEALAAACILGALAVVSLPGRRDR
ncbi:hypothetical protein OTERR_15060 [Oryzomicrobium terrae]|uniref:EamA domain-containing protein n=1 Tax=Oryzomicrobium terrae TaxID=1735038 RepID=A0A5C1E7P9_9RHOO|nr:DMT family transporter [Oryzomicrobium terrae]QEL64982.1 hypothetical protein OTERR_15060 [Oryzomicrobium terrae]